jgi:hypothetical protein
MNHPRVDDAFSKALRAELVSRVEKTAPSPRRKPVRLWLAVGAVAGAALLGGAAAGILVLPGSQQASPQQASPVSSALASYKVEDTLAAFGGMSYDYNPFPSPEAIAAASQVIVQGTVEGIREGRTGTGINSLVLIVNINGVVQGELPRGNDGNVYLELHRAGSEPLYYEKALPKGAAVVAYLVQAGDGLPKEGIDVRIDNPKAGRPDGQALFLPTGPQGLILQVGDHDVVWPLLGERAPGKIADTLPGGGLIRG